MEGATSEIKLAAKYRKAERVHGREVLDLIESENEGGNMYGNALKQSIRDILAMDRYISGECADLH